MNRPRIIALTATVATALLLVLLLVGSHLVFDPSTLQVPPRPVAEVAEIDEEFVDLLDVAYGPDRPSQAYTPAEADNASQAAQSAGSDSADAGDKGLPAPDVTSERPA
ncbi:MAG: hypothetical protein K2F79_06540, partial [Muribaculaceae bacterium]|nr:hypothetical protein [Muribaculaceae bacterium]